MKNKGYEIFMIIFCLFCMLFFTFYIILNFENVYKTKRFEWKVIVENDLILDYIELKEKEKNGVYIKNETFIKYCQKWL